MNQADVRRLALINAVVAEIEGMKVANIERLENNKAFAYGEDVFFEKSAQLENLAHTPDDQI